MEHITERKSRELK